MLGEVHDLCWPVPAEQPYWLKVPERSLFTDIAIFEAIGTGKTSGCPYAGQLIAYKAQDPDKPIGGLVPEVRGDFCHEVREILSQHQRAEDYVEVSLQTEHSYNPPYGDLDAYALAYNNASLLNAINQAFRLMNARPVWRTNQSRQASDQTIPSSLRLRLHVSFGKEQKAEMVTNCDHVKNLKLSCVLPTAFTEHGALWRQRDSILSGRLQPAKGRARTVSRLLVT